MGLSGSRSSSSIAPARQRQHVASLPQGRRHILLSPSEPRVTTATQTTLPGTRNQRPFGWEMDAQRGVPTGILPPPNRFASLQTNGQQGHRTQQPSWLPPRPVPASQLKRTVRRRHFSQCLQTPTAVLMPPVIVTVDGRGGALLRRLAGGHAPAAAPARHGGARGGRLEARQHRVGGAARPGPRGPLRGPRRRAHARQYKGGRPEKAAAEHRKLL